MDFASLREQISLTQRMTYLNTGWNGPSPVPVIEAIKARLDFENDNGPTTPDVRETGEAIKAESREAVASLLNASSVSEVLLTENTTDGLNVVMSGLPWQEGDEIITCSLEHPSILVPSYNAQHVFGARVKVLQLEPDEPHESIVAKVEEAITDRTRMVFFSHIQFSSGIRMPIEEVSRLTKPRGIWLLLDGAQGPGHVRVDVQQLGCDFYSMSGQKWVLGPDGTGALYIREELIPIIRPVRVSGHAMTSHDHLGNYEPKTDDIDKYVVSTASLALRAGFLEAVRIHLDIGLDTIEEHNVKLAASVKTGLSAIPGVRLLSPLEGPGSSGLASFRIEGADQMEAAKSLWESERIMVRSVAHPPGIRASMHAFNTEDEAAGLVDAVRRVAS